MNEEIAQALKDNLYHKQDTTDLDIMDTNKKQMDIIVDLRGEINELKELISERENKPLEEIEKYIKHEFDGRRLDRTCKHLYSRIRRSKSDDTKAKLSNALVSATSKKIEITDTLLRLHEIIKRSEKTLDIDKNDINKSLVNKNK